MSDSDIPREQDLKPCPFCGHWAAFHFDKPEQPAEIWVECENSECMAEVRALTGTKKFAAEHWNHRVTPATIIGEGK